MPLSLNPPPIRFDESLERIEPDEAETVEQLIETLTGINQTTLEHEEHAYRSVHAKSHALLTGELIVPDDLPRELAQGIFAKEGRYPLVMRLSTVPGDILDDSVSTPRGMAVKIIGVEGERLPGSDGDVTQDFVLVNGPVFSAPNAKRFASTPQAGRRDDRPGRGRQEGLIRCLARDRAGDRSLRREEFDLAGTRRPTRDPPPWRHLFQSGAHPLRRLRGEAIHRTAFAEPRPRSPTPSWTSTENRTGCATR